MLNSRKGQIGPDLRLVVNKTLHDGTYCTVDTEYQLKYINNDCELREAHSSRNVKPHSTHMIQYFCTY